MIKDKPEISVLMVAYNVEEYISDAIISILHQVYDNFELIIIDDASNDDTVNILNHYAAEDHRVKIYVNKHNQGVASNRNIAISKANGKYITFVDPDDIVTKYYLLNLFNSIIQNNSDISMSGFFAIDEEETYYPKISSTGNRNMGKSVTLTSKKATELLLYQKGIDVSPWGKLYRTEHIKKYLFTPDYIFEDFLLIPKVVFEAENIAITKNKDYAYRRRTSSIMHSKFDSKKLMILDVSNDIFIYFNRTGDKELIAAASSKCFSALLNILKMIKDSNLNTPSIHRHFITATKMYAQNISLVGPARLKVKVMKVVAIFFPVIFKFIFFRKRWNTGNE